MYSILDNRITVVRQSNRKVCRYKRNKFIIPIYNLESIQISTHNKNQSYILVINLTLLKHSVNQGFNSPIPLNINLFHPQISAASVSLCPYVDALLQLEIIFSHPLKQALS